MIINNTYNYTGSKVVVRYESKFQSFVPIRHANCEMLLPSFTSDASCIVCTNHRKSLIAMLSKQCQHLKSSNIINATSISSHTNYRYLLSDEKTITLHTLSNVLQTFKTQIQYLKDKIDTNRNISVSIMMFMTA